MREGVQRKGREKARLDWMAVFRGEVVEVHGRQGVLGRRA